MAHKCIYPLYVYLYVWYMSGIVIFQNFVTRPFFKIETCGSFWLEIQLIWRSVPLRRISTYREVGFLNYLKSSNYYLILQNIYHSVWQANKVETSWKGLYRFFGGCTIFFGSIEGSRAYSGAFLGSPLWACQPTDSCIKFKFESSLLINYWCQLLF